MAKLVPSGGEPPVITKAEVPMATRAAEDVQGHWLLARLGKRVLRPGGLRLTRTLLRETGVAGQRVVEFAPGMGRTATLVLRHRPATYVGVDADPQAARYIDRIVSPRGRAVAAEAAASGLPDRSADVVLAEGVLTIQSEAGKREIVAEGVRLLRPGGRYVLHELALKPDAAARGEGRQIRSALAQAMHVNARPKTAAEWGALLTGAGLEVRAVHTATLALLEPHRIVADEGVRGTIRFARNLIADKPARRRVRTMAATMRHHKRYLQAVGIVAVKPGELSGTVGAPPHREEPAIDGSTSAATCGAPGVVRITTFQARPGHARDLGVAAAQNAAEARRAPGCRSAEVCVAPDDSGTVLVLSRWANDAALRDFLGWHEGLAHRSVSPHAAGEPRSVHYPVVEPAV